MAINPVTLSEVLRPWHSAGVTLFLMDELLSTDVELFFQEELPLPEKKENASFNVTSLGKRNVKKEEQTPSIAKKSSIASPLVNKDLWPDHWKQAYTKVTPAPVLWTYDLLGEDLGGKANPERSQCLRSIIGSLQLPKGSNVFWPPSLFVKEQLEANQAVFLSGINNLKPRLIIIIGSSAIRHFSEEITLSVPFTQQIHSGRLFILLPEFTDLFAIPSLREKSIIYLRASLQNISVLFNK